VDGKQPRNERAAPDESSSLRQQQKQQHHIEGMPEDALSVMSRRAQPERLHIQHVRQPRQRMPIGFRSCSESPRHATRGQPLLNVPIRGDVVGIVVVDESILQRGVVEREGAEEKQTAR